MTLKRMTVLLLGGCVWVAALAAITISISTLYARTHRFVRSLTVTLPPDAHLSTGDLVFTTSGSGLVRIGEVAAVLPHQAKAELAIVPDAFLKLNQSTTATTWQTPLSAEDALEALLPETIQEQAARTIAQDWQANDDALIAAWGPLFSDLIGAYLDVIGEDIEQSIRRRETELWSITKSHAAALSAEWPAMRERLRPILQAHLTPVLGRLLDEAVSDAPKVSIAWQVARGRNEEAFRQMLDWIADYLVEMPEADKEEMADAVGRTWDAARGDPVLVDRFRTVARGVLENPALRDVLTDIYREAIADNPQTAAFIRAKVLESEPMRQRFYEFIETFASTARRVAALCLFDETGRTRPEVVHLVRSIALNRRVAWVTLSTPVPDAPSLDDGAVLGAGRGGTRR